MKLAAAVVLAAVASTAVAADSNQVRGYTRQDGTYVEPHMRTNPNSSRMDNWSTQGNTNPYTGQQGTVNPDYQRQSDPFSSNRRGNSRGW